MAVDKHTRTVFLSNEPMTVTSYLRSITDDLVARFGSAEQGQTNLDLLKAETQKSFRGGMFQRVMDDPERVSTIENAYYNKLDENLYPTPEWLSATNGTDIGGGLFDWCYFNGLIYATYTRLNPPNSSLQGLFKLDPSDGTITAISLPSNLSGANQLRITAYGSSIFIAGKGATGTGYRGYRYDGNTTFTDVQGNASCFMEFNGTLYFVADDGTFAQVTNATSTPITWTNLGNVGPKTNSGIRAFKDYVNFNNALYIGMESGLYRFDGTKVNTVIDYSRAVDFANFAQLATFNGRMYYTIGNKLYQFDGINIEELQDFTAAYTINDLVAGHDRLWISVTIDTGVPYADKFGTGPTTYSHSVFCYNGIGFFLYKSFSQSLPLEWAYFKLIPVSSKVFGIQPDVYLNGSLEPRSNGFWVRTLALSDEFTTTNAGPGFVVTSSEIDNDYPAVTKTINALLINYGGLTFGEGSFKVEFQYLVDNVWSEWSEVWNTDNVGSGGVSNEYNLHEQVELDTSPLLASSPQQYNKIRYRITLAITDSTPETLPFLSDFTARYTLQPRVRMKWLLTIDLAGADTRSLTTGTNSDDTLEDRTSTHLRKIIFDAYRNKKPILFYDYDWSEIKDDDPLKIKGTDFIVAGDVIAIQNASDMIGKWINRRVDSVVYDELNDDTALTLGLAGYRRGIGGATATTITTGTQVRKSHAVYIKNIRNERYVVDPNSLNDGNGENGYTDIPSQIILDLVEV